MASRCTRPCSGHVLRASSSARRFDSTPNIHQHTVYPPGNGTHSGRAESASLGDGLGDFLSSVGRFVRQTDLVDTSCLLSDRCGRTSRCSWKGRQPAPVATGLLRICVLRRRQLTAPMTSWILRSVVEVLMLQTAVSCNLFAVERLPVPELRIRDASRS